MLTERDRKVLKWIEDYKAISINQAAQIFFNGSYESCRRRLKQLEDREILKSYKSNILGKIYYQEKKLKDHELLVYEFLKEICKLGGSIRKIKIQPRYLKGLIRPDAYLEIIFKKYVYFIFLEIDYTHYTDINKINLYEHLYSQKEIQKQCYNTFPTLLISRPSISEKYSSENFNIIFTDLSFKNINEVLLRI